MARDWYINGEALVKVSNAALGGVQELGLTDSPIHISPTFHHLDMRVDAMGGQAPPETQFMLMEARITMSLIHFDYGVLNSCIQSSMAGAPAVGTMPRAGSLMGNSVALGASGNNLITLGITTPVGPAPWKFYACYLTDFPWPLGTEKSVVQLTWRAIPYTVDPVTADGIVVWDHSFLI